MSGILIGIDVGSTVLKAAAFDAKNGKLLARAGTRLALRLEPDGTREQSAVSLSRAMEAALAGIRRDVGRRWRETVGIGLAAQGGSAIIADKDTGKAITPLILWNDTRALRHLDSIRRRATSSFWRRHTWRDQPGAGLARILWFRETQPDLLSGNNIYVGAGEYCYFRLTGLWRQDACNALQIGCYNAARMRLDSRLMDFAGMPLSFVAPLREGHCVNPLSRAAAARLGLSANVPVAGPYMDHEAGYLSAAGVSARPLQCSLGTAWVGNFAVPQSVKSVSAFQLVLPPITGADRLNVQPLLTGNVTWDWALAQFVDSDHARALKEAGGIFGAELLPRPGLTALPWLNAPNPLMPQTVGGAAFAGVGPMTGSSDFLRATAFAMTCEMARVFRECIARGYVDSAVLGGGAARGAFFRIMLAALFDPLPVLFARDEDLSGARGCLSVFGGKVSKCDAVRVKRPRNALRERIAEGYSRHLDLLKRICGDTRIYSLSFGKSS